METSDFIEKYILETRNLKRVCLFDHRLDGSVIKVLYSCTYLNGDQLDDICAEIDLLDYITFVFKQK